MTEQTKPKSWLRNALDKYNKFCDELGVNQGTCRGCVPVVKFDPEPEQKKQNNNEKV
ncbi:DUF5363 domain-containing protein [Lonepinella koalarum]|uniref:DUF5363 family protein n=1 Tax=Lonepinella koalarum TaxID=53417 RepID=A0A4R1KX26_9PAST|nr:DUF5363 domain-containing protein [Lonepinella koalarum]TCK69906.1 hypothetical protein EV692_1120 [Lonepinella koalarum]